MPQRRRAGFYERTLGRLLDEGVLRRDLSVIVACGGEADRDVLLRLGFEKVTITNVDASGADDRYAPFDWAWQDAEQLAADDESYDVGIVSAGLHHCHSPHRALLELYRVSRVAVVGFEARDSLLMRAAVRAGLAEQFEISAVAHQNLRAGGVANSPTPNYVYRWTEREVAKTITAFAPHARPNIRYFRELELPPSLIQREGSSLQARALRLAAPLAAGLARVAPRQSNQFAFVIHKPHVPDDLQPWMTVDGDRVAPDPTVIGARYRIGPPSDG